MKEERYRGFGTSFEEAERNLLLNIVGFHDLERMVETFEHNGYIYILDWEESSFVSKYLNPGAIWAYRIIFYSRKIDQSKDFYIAQINSSQYRDISKLKNKKE